MANRSAFPFRAALFDLDGTLLDSLHVWRDVDARFFAERGIDDYSGFGDAVQGLSFTESARYAVERFNLPETAEEVRDIWLAMGADAYAHDVRMLPGAIEYLRMLKRAGVKLAVATSNRQELFGPALEAAGVQGLFDVLCTTAMVGEQGKRSGAVYALAAKQLGVAPEDCVVFEDAPDGILGAKALGMRAYAVRDPASPDRDDTFAGADGIIDGFEDMRAYHAFPDNARRCVIFTARCEGDPRDAYVPRSGDFVLCADGGWQIAARMGVQPDLVMGDFDSSPAPEGMRIERFPVEKDDTDTMLCLKKGLALGFDDFTLVGGFGGRLDHTLANLQTLLYARRRHARAELTDGTCWARVIEEETLTLARRPGTLSVFALDGPCRGVTLRGVKYPAEGIELSSDFPLGVSNAFAADTARITVREGALLVTMCRE